MGGVAAKADPPLPGLPPKTPGERENGTTPRKKPRRSTADVTQIVGEASRGSSGRGYAPAATRPGTTAGG